VLTYKVESNCHFPVPGWNCMAHRQALQGFPDTSQVSLHKNNKINFPFFIAIAAGSGEVAVAFNFISEHTVQYLQLVSVKFGITMSETGNNNFIRISLV
jgi:hypothetical protein